MLRIIGSNNSPRWHNRYIIDFDPGKLKEYELYEDDVYIRGAINTRVYISPTKFMRLHVYNGSEKRIFTAVCLAATAYRENPQIYIHTIRWELFK